jgi:hypothetical protein
VRFLSFAVSSAKVDQIPPDSNYEAAIVKQFTCRGIAVSARLAASLATAIQVLRWPNREGSYVWPTGSQFFNPKLREAPLSFAELLALADRATYAKKKWPSETGDELSVDMPSSGMKENGCSEKVVEDYAGANRPIRKADCEGGDRRDSP